MLTLLLSNVSPSKTEIVPTCQICGGVFDKVWRIHISLRMMCISISPSWLLLFHPQWFMSFPTHLVFFSLSLSHVEFLVSYLIQSPVGLSAAAPCSGVNYWSDILLRLTCSVSYTHNFLALCSVKYKHHVCLVKLSQFLWFNHRTRCYWTYILPNGSD